MLPFAFAMAAAVAALLVAEGRQSRLGVWIAKPIASTLFVAAALSWGALEWGYGHAILGALLLSWIGDVLLIPSGMAFFRAGLASFLLGHVGFCVAFLIRGVAWGGTLPALAVLA